MEIKPYLVIIDTTEAKRRQSVGAGILNVHVILATSAIEAKQTFLRVFSPMVRQQIRDFIYAYDLDEMKTHLSNLDASKNLPLFSFLPLAGGRPDRQSDVATIELGSKTLEPNTQSEAQQIPQRPTVQPLAEARTQIQASSVSKPRSREFQNFEEGRPTLTNRLTAEQQALINSVGAIPAFNGANEGSTPRINASTGRNQNLTNAQPQQQTSNKLSQVQADLLAKLAPSHTGPEVFQEDIEEAAESSPVIEDPSLTQIDNKVLSAEDIKRLNEEIQGV